MVTYTFWQFRWIYILFGGFFLSYGSQVAAQNISGQWQGTLFQPNGPFPQYPYFMDLSQNTNNTVTGFTIIRLPSDTTRFGQHNILNGLFNTSNLSFTYQTQLVAQNPPPGLNWCNPQGNLIYDPVNETLSGPWAVSGNCAPGNIVLYRIVLKSAQTYCESSSIVARVTGNNIKWYADAAKTNLLFSGNTFNTQLSATTTFYVTQTNSGMESDPVSITINITPSTRSSISRSICEGNAFEGYAATGTYIDTLRNAAANGCDSIRTLNLTVNPLARTTINRTICQGETFEGYTSTGTYVNTFPGSNGCDSIRTLILTVNPKINPQFTFNQNLSYCAGETTPLLPNISQNGIGGSWQPTAVSNTQSGVYTFTPDAWINVENFNSLTNGNLNGQNGWVAGTGSFTPNPPAAGTSPANVVVGADPDNASNKVAILSGAHAFAYKNIRALNPTDTATLYMRIRVANIDTISGNAATAQNESAGFFAVSDATNPTEFAEMDMQFGVNPDFGQPGDTPSPWSIRNSQLVFPSQGSSLADSTWYNVWFVIDNNNKTFKLYLSGGAFTTPVQIVSLPGSLNSTPATEAGTFSFRNQAAQGPLTALKALIRTGANNYAQLFVDDIFHATGDVLSLPSAFCVNPYTLNVTINQPITPTFTQIAPICSGNSFILPTTSNNSITGSWSPAINNTQTTTYTFTPNASQCANPQTMTITVNDRPVVNELKDTIVYDGNLVPATLLNSNLNNTSFTWQNSNPAIGLPASGIGNIPSFQAVNLSTAPITGIITITPSANGCPGNTISFKITVLPLSKDVYIPNLFSPNGDGTNDVLFVYGKYIDKIEMNIFNQWGELVKTIRDKNQGWDGTHKGKPQPIGVYIYTAKIVMKDGRNINQKGSVTIYR